MGLKVSNGCVFIIVLVFWLFLLFCFWPRIRNVVRLRMLLGFLSLPGQLIMGLGMGELDGVAGVGGLFVTDGGALNKMFFPSLGLFASCRLDLMLFSCIG